MKNCTRSQMKIFIKCVNVHDLQLNSSLFFINFKFIITEYSIYILLIGRMKKTITYKVLGSPTANSNKDDNRKPQSSTKSPIINDINILPKKNKQESSKQTSLTRVVTAGKPLKNMENTNKESRQRILQGKKQINQDQNIINQQNQQKYNIVGQQFKQAMIQTIKQLRQDFKDVRKSIISQQIQRKKNFEILNCYIGQKHYQKKPEENKLQLNLIFQERINILTNAIDRLDMKMENKLRNDEKRYNQKFTQLNENLISLIQDFKCKFQLKNREFSNKFTNIDNSIDTFKNQLITTKQILKKNIINKKDENIERNIESIMCRLENYNEVLDEVKLYDNRMEYKIEEIKKQYSNFQKFNKKQFEQVYRQIKKIRDQVLHIGESCDRLDHLESELKKSSEKVTIQIFDEFIGEIKDKINIHDKYIESVALKTEQFKYFTQQVFEITNKNKQKIDRFDQQINHFQRDYKQAIQNSLQTYQNSVHQQLSKIISQYNSNFQHIENNNSEIGLMVSQIIKINSIISQKLCSFVSNKIDCTTFKQIIHEMNEKMNEIQQSNLQKMNDIQKKQFKFEHQLRILKQNVENSINKESSSLLDASDQFKYLPDRNILKQYGDGDDILEQHCFKSDQKSSSFKKEYKKQQIEQEEKVSNLYD